MLHPLNRATPCSRVYRGAKIFYFMVAHHGARFVKAGHGLGLAVIPQSLDHGYPAHLPSRSSGPAPER